MTHPTSLAVVARRIEPKHSLDFFPTPPWATRAFMAAMDDLAQQSPILRDEWQPAEQTVLDPCCGEGHMAEVFKEDFGRVVSLDVHDYGYGGVRNFIPETGARVRGDVDWAAFNAPFAQLEAFIAEAFRWVRCGVAVLCRTQAVEGVRRYKQLWENRPPSLILPYAERVPMHRGRWVVNGKTASAYCWLIWFGDALTTGMQSGFSWIPPGARRECSRSDDPVRFNGVYQLRTLISKPNARKKKWKTTFHSPAEWQAMGRAA